MNLVAKYRRLALQPSIDSYKRFYSPMCDSSDIVQKQLQDLNLSWKVSLKYSSWLEKLPVLRISRTTFKAGHILINVLPL